MHESVRPLTELVPLRDPILIAAFSGFSDAGGAAIATLELLEDEWDAEPLAEIDPQPFYDFTVQRPHVRMEDGQRVLDWPTNQFSVARPTGSNRDIVLLGGIEPHTHWRTFTEALADVMRTLGITTSITLGAQPGPVPHTRPLPVTLSASHEDFSRQFGLPIPVSRYEGPTGIVGVMNLHHRSLGMRNASLWVQVPHYLSAGPDPNAIVALLQTLDHGLGTHTDTSSLLDQRAQFEDQVREAMRQSSDIQGYVRQLEEAYDRSEPSVPPTRDEPQAAGELPSSDELLSDLEDFLRRQQGSND